MKDKPKQDEHGMKEKHVSPGDEAKTSHEKKKKTAEHAVDKDSEWQQKFNELNDKYLRLYSEFDNYRKRTQKERIELGKFASEEIILSLLPVIDDLERALRNAIVLADGEKVVAAEGLQLILNKFSGILVQKGLESIPAMGEEFNVDYHDAITSIPAPSEDMKGKVVDEIERGYTLNGKVIRYSKVVVGS